MLHNVVLLRLIIGLAATGAYSDPQKREISLDVRAAASTWGVGPRQGI